MSFSVSLLLHFTTAAVRGLLQKLIAFAEKYSGGENFQISLGKNRLETDWKIYNGFLEKKAKVG